MPSSGLLCIIREESPEFVVVDGRIYGADVDQ